MSGEEGGGAGSKRPAEGEAPDSPVRKRAALLASPGPPDLLVEVTDLAAEAQRLLEFKTHKAVKLREIAQVQLLESFLPLVEEYEQWGRRKRFLWQWLDYGTSLTTLECVPEEHREKAKLAKCLANMLNVVTDDIGDEDCNGDLLQALLAVLFREGARTREETFEERVARIDRIDLTEEERQRSMFCLKVLLAFKDAASSLPGWEEYEQVLRFDVQQMINEKFHSSLKNNHLCLMNEAEHTNYAPHTMNAMIFCTLDVMASPALLTRKEQIGPLRAIFWNANVMANIANCVATWRREVPVRDWSSALFPQALDMGVITLHQLEVAPPEVIMQRLDSAGIEEILIHKWIDCANKMKRLGRRITVVDIGKFYKQNEDFLELHLACIGKI